MNPEPDPDLYPFQLKVKKNLTFFFKKISILCQKILKIMKHITLTRKIEQCKLALLASKWKVGSGSADPQHWILGWECNYV